MKDGHSPRMSLYSDQASKSDQLKHDLRDQRKSLGFRLNRQSMANQPVSFQLPEEEHHMPHLSHRFNADIGHHRGHHASTSVADFKRMSVKPDARRSEARKSGDARRSEARKSGEARRSEARKSEARRSEARQSEGRRSDVSCASTQPDDMFDAFSEASEEEISIIDRVRGKLAQMIMSQRFEMSVGIVIIANFAVIAWETNARTARLDTTPGTPERDHANTVLDIINAFNLLFLAFYSFECSVRLFVQRWDFFRYVWNLFDMSIVLVGIAGALADVAVSEGSDVADMQVLRSLRMVRMLRASRILVAFDELYALVSGLKNAMKTLMWAAGLIFLMLTMWSIIAVEYMNKLVRKLDEEGHYGSCAWCADAFGSIFNANLTFFQIMTGDGWSNLARPLIHKHPWTGAIFVAVIFTMVFGLLNLIIAVIVDSAAQAREEDLMHMAQRKDQSRAVAWECFNDMVFQLDENSDGAITVDELKTGLMNSPELAAYLTVMGVEEEDLHMVFELLDSNNDGTVCHEEFADQLYRMKTQELPIAVCYIKHSIAHLSRQMELMGTTMDGRIDELMAEFCQKSVDASQADQNMDALQVQSKTSISTSRSSHEEPCLPSESGASTPLPVPAIVRATTASCESDGGNGFDVEHTSALPNSSKPKAAGLSPRDSGLAVPTTPPSRKRGSLMPTASSPALLKLQGKDATSSSSKPSSGDAEHPIVETQRSRGRTSLMPGSNAVLEAKAIVPNMVNMAETVEEEDEEEEEEEGSQEGGRPPDLS